MSNLKYNTRTKVLIGIATDLNDWVRKCDEFENERNIQIDRPGSATVKQRSDGTKEYKLRLT